MIGMIRKLARGTHAAGEDGDRRAIVRTVQKHYDARSFDCMGDVVLEEVNNRTLLGEVGNYFDIDQWQRVVDVGCGASARNPFFARRYWDQEAIAVDLSWRTVQKARERIAVPFVNASVLALPFRDGISGRSSPPKQDTATTARASERQFNFDRQFTTITGY